MPRRDCSECEHYAIDEDGLDYCLQGHAKFFFDGGFDFGTKEEVLQDARECPDYAQRR